MSTNCFEPFMDRLSRDIRNDLSESLVAVLKNGTLRPAEEVAAGYRRISPASWYEEYMHNRLRQYRVALDRIHDGLEDPLWRGLVLWDLGLFFEVHEILEHAWLREQGEEKLLLQAMIRAAGVYIKMEYGYTDAAQKIAAKAVPVLKQNHKRLSAYIDPAVLIRALEYQEKTPPLLLGTIAE